MNAFTYSTMLENHICHVNSNSRFTAFQEYTDAEISKHGNNIHKDIMYHQQNYLHPAVLEVWRSQQNEYVQEVQQTGRAVRLGGDGRANTPGHCAMFGSYTLMDLDQNKVVDSQFVQVFNMYLVIWYTY